MMARSTASSSSRRGYAYQRVQDTEMEEFPPNHEHHGRHSNDTPIELVETKVGSSNQHASLEERTRSPEETSESSETLLEKDEDDLENGAPEEESFGQNPFKPLPDLPAERPRVLTARALIVGLCAGALVNASNVYLGLKSGWTFSANLFGAIVGFALIKVCSKTFAETVPILGGSFGPRENNIVQTAAMASGGLSNVFVSAYPALYQLKLLDTPSSDYWRIISLTAVGGYFGLFFATPLRKFFIIYVARELSLVFPSASATAMTIASMHDAVRGESLGKRKMRALSWAFGTSLLLRIVSQYALGILWEWHFFTWFYIWSGYSNAAIAVENWGWYVQFTPAFIGSGMLVGLNVAISFFAGSVLAWGIIGPLLVHFNIAFGKLVEPGDPKWGDVVSFSSFSGKFSSRDTPSPRYWLLWPGVLAMIFISFTELALQWRIILFAWKALIQAFIGWANDLAKALHKDISWLPGQKTSQEPEIEDPASPDQQVKMWMWLPGLLAVIGAMCVSLGLQYDMPLGMSLLSVFLAFFFSFLAIQCTGVTDITPLTAASKASQIILGGATKSNGWSISHSQTLNLLGGALANMGANQATDLTQDFRVGFLLDTPPIQQWVAQAVGTLVAVFLAPAMFVLFMHAYPCVIDMSDECAFSAPSVAAWRAVAIAVTDPSFPIPKSSAIFSVAFAAFGSAMVLVKHFCWRGKWEWVRTWHPNMMCVALAFVLPQTFYGTAMTIGAIVTWVWQRRNPQMFEMLGYAIAAGLIAGEGIGGVVNAVLQVLGLSGDKYGTNLGCPIACQ